MATKHLGKADAEALLNAIDLPALAGVIAAALWSLLDGNGDQPPWTVLVDQAADRGGWSAQQRAAVQAGESEALQRCAVDLAELRSL